jgi:hypothetical protein
MKLHCSSDQTSPPRISASATAERLPAVTSAMGVPSDVSLAPRRSRHASPEWGVQTRSSAGSVAPEATRRDRRPLRRPSLSWLEV